MPEHDPTRTDRLALYMRARAAEKAGRDEAVAVVERWNARACGWPGRAVVADDPGRAPSRYAVA